MKELLHKLDLYLGEKMTKLLRRIGYLRPLFAGELTISKAELSAKVFRADGSTEDIGVICTKKVTDAFVQDIVGALAASGDETNFVNFKYHDAGTDNTAEARTQTALGTAWGGSRATGTQVEGGSTPTFTYQSVGTIAFTSSHTIVEHGLFNASTSGTMMDRSVFAAIGVSNGDSIQFTYTLSITSEA